MINISLLSKKDIFLCVSIRTNKIGHISEEELFHSVAKGRAVKRLIWL